MVRRIESEQKGSKNSAQICCHAELNHFLSKDKRFHPFVKYFDNRPSIKDLIESQGVPHTEIHLIVVNGRSVDLSYRVLDQDVISVYPLSVGRDVIPAVRLRPELRNVRFVLDVHLQKLARLLRMIGFDAIHDQALGDADLIDISVRENRILLTRDKGILKSRQLVYGSFVHAQDPLEQLKEVVIRFELLFAFKPFSRCLLCNDAILGIDRQIAKNSVPEQISASVHEFFICRGCGQIYWKGSHYDRMREVIESLTASIRGMAINCFIDMNGITRLRK